MICAEDSTTSSSKLRQMSGFAERNVRRVTFSAFAVCYTKATTTVAQVTSVRITVGSARSVSSSVEHRTFSSFFSDLRHLNERSAGHPGKHMYVNRLRQTAFFSSEDSCVVNDHLCGEPCKLLGKRGCLEECTKVS